MFFRKQKNYFLFLILSILIIPYNVFAYSEKVIVGGDNIGISLNTPGIMVVGTYKVGSSYPARDAGLKEGDKIISLNNEGVSSIDDMSSKISVNDTNELDVGYVRDGVNKKASLKLYKDESGVFKTGLYVKDNVSGVGTLTYIDPETKIFGALGHEIQEQTTGKLLEIKDGKIFTSSVTGIIPSSDGTPGEKVTEYNKDNVIGSVFSNTDKGIFGIYNGKINSDSIYSVGKSDDIKLGEAEIFTVLKNNDVKKYSINITKINDLNQNTQNFVFEITDNELLKKTNGIIQGMSGSPIIQDGKIIGAVTHVVVDNPHKGYGIFITNMLEEGER